LWLGAAALPGCQCDQPVEPLYPKIVVTPTSLIFRALPVGAGSSQQLAIDVTNDSRAPLFISGVTLEQAGEFSLPSNLLLDCTGAPRTASDVNELALQKCAEILVNFTPTEVGSVTNVVDIRSNDPKNPVVKVTLQAQGLPAAQPDMQVCVLSASGAVVPSACSDLSATPQVIPTIAFGTVNDNHTATQQIRILNNGQGALHVSSTGIVSNTNDLSIPMPPAYPLAIEPSMHIDLTVALTPTGNGMIAGLVRIESNDPGNAQVDVPITATEKTLPCTNPTASIRATTGTVAVPSSGVLQDTTVTFTASASGGTGPIASYTWTLVSAPSGNTSMLMSSGNTATLDCTESGTYEVGVVIADSDGCASTRATASVVVNAAPPTCGAATEFIYTVDTSGNLGKFTPGTAPTYTNLGTIPCNSTGFSNPNTMGVDRQGVAWIEYEDGELFKVDTTTLACYATGFNASQTPSDAWGSCFAIDAAGGSTDTYYIADSTTLQTINTATLAVTTVGTFAGSGFTLNNIDEPELTGTPSALLYGFFPSDTWEMAQIGRTTGTVSNAVQLPIISTYVSSPGNWAFASWGSDFWFFVGDGATTDVFHFNGATSQTTHAMNINSAIVGAGVSPCVQAQ
jgi:hypothetical protein